MDQENITKISNSKIGKIIFLNGPSSAGKTTLSENLQKKLAEPFMHIGMDKMIYMMPPHINNWQGQKGAEGFWWLPDIDCEGKTIYHLQFGPYAKKSMATLKDFVVTFAKNGHNVIVDEVCFGTKGIESWKEKLLKLPVLFVGVKAPLRILELRERIRGDRIIGSARAQYYTVHQGVIYDIEVDTHNQMIEECVEQIISKLPQLMLE